jgi:hypothetical protein
MKKGALVVAAWLFLLLPTTSHATYIVYGVGGSSCGELIKNLDSSEADKTLNFMVISWVQGYVSAMSSCIKPMEKTNATVIKLYLDSYCRKMPEATIQEAADGLVAELWTENPKRRTP